MSNPSHPSPEQIPLVDAALQVIARRGPQHLTFGEVAEEAGVRDEDVRRLFGDEQTLLIEALYLSGRRSLERMRQPHDPQDSATLDALRNILNSPHNQSQDYVWVVFWAGALGSDALKATLSEVNQWHREAWRDLLERDTKRGMLRRDLDLNLETDRLMLLIDGLALRSALELPAWPPERQLELLTESLGLLQDPV
ncbi:MAG: TetR family transcriptional regulator C-terminal domain-containing protein [Meiothermus sp.]|nr:TetR family transcriptional regulator C-terminal domain-containing protein [Meiothermus sp.]